MLEEVTNICAYSTVMAFIDEVIAFLKDIASGFGFILLTIAAVRAAEVIQIGILLLEVTQARRN
jgi:hypothetical protein